MKKTRRIINLTFGDPIKKQRIFPSEEATQDLLATLLNQNMSFKDKVKTTKDLLMPFDGKIDSEQVAQVTEALFLCMAKGCVENEDFAHYCELIRQSLKRSLRFREGALMGSMQAVAWLYENQLWDELDLHVGYIGFLHDYFLSSDEQQPCFDTKLSGTFSNISTALVAACRKGLPEFFHVITRYPIVWNPVLPKRDRIGESPLFRQIINEISYRAFLLIETNERLKMLNSFYNPEPPKAS